MDKTGKVGPHADGLLAALVRLERRVRRWELFPVFGEKESAFPANVLLAADQVYRARVAEGGTDAEERAIWSKPTHRYIEGLSQALFGLLLLGSARAEMEARSIDEVELPTPILPGQQVATVLAGALDVLGEDDQPLDDQLVADLVRWSTELEGPAKPEAVVQALLYVATEMLFDHESEGVLTYTGLTLRKLVRTDAEMLVSALLDRFLHLIVARREADA